MKRFQLFVAHVLIVIAVIAGQDLQAQSKQVHTMIGTVSDAEGAPVAGAKVSLHRNHISRESFENNRMPAGHQINTTTADAQGSFTLGVTSDYSQTLIVEAPGYLTEFDRFMQKQNLREQLMHTGDQPTSFTRKITLLKQGRVTGIVADDQGQPLSGVSISAYPAMISMIGSHYDSRLDEATSDGDGVFELDSVPAKSVALRLSAPGFATYYITATPGEQVAVNMSRGATVTGRALQFETGQPVGGAWIELRSHDPASGPRQHEEQPYPRQWFGRALSGESGAFAFRNVPPGEYQVGISNQESDTEMKVWNPGGDGRFTVTVGEDGAVAPIELPLFSGYTISGNVVEMGTTQTVPGARVWLMNDHPNRWTTTDATGFYQFDKVFADSRARLTAEVDGYSMQPDEMYSGQSTKTLTLELPTSTTAARLNIPMIREQKISGKVIDAGTSMPLAGVTIHAVGNHFYPGNHNSKKDAVISDSDGRFAVPVVPGEAVRIRAEMSGYAPAISDPVKPVEQEDIILRMTTGVSLHGAVIDPADNPVPDANVHAVFRIAAARAFSGDTNSYHETISQGAKSGPDGAFTLTNIPADGTLEVSASKDGFAASERQTHNPTAGDDITSVVLQLRIAKHLAGRVLDSAGQPVQGASLQATSQGTSGNAYDQTENDGQYRLDALPDAPVDISINHPKHGNEWFYDVAVGRDGVDFKYGTGDKNGRTRYEREAKERAKASGVTLYGIVVDYQTALPVKDFKVVGSRFLTATLNPDLEGAFTLEGLRVSTPYQMIRIIAPGYAPYDSGSIYIMPGQTEVHRTFKLGPGGSVTGRAVEKGTGKPVPGVIVSLGEVDADSGAGMPAGSEQKIQPVATDGEGRFVLPGVGQGRKIVSFQPPPATGFVRMSQEVDVIYNEASDLGDVEFGTGGAIKGRLVRTPGDVPIPNAQIKLRGGDTAITGSTGEFEFTNLVNGLYYVEAPQYGANSWIGVEQLETKELILEVGTGKLIGTVTRAGKPVACNVKVQKIGYGQSVARFIKSDASGRFIFDGLAPGRWSVEFTGSAPAQFTAADAVVMPESGESVEKTFTLPSGGLRVTVVDAAGKAVDGATVIVRQQTGADSALQASGRTHNTNADGIANFDGLDAGTYAITATDPDGLRGEKSGVAIQNDQGAAETVTLEAAAGGTLISTALNLANGKPVPTAWCYLFNEEGTLFEHTKQRDELGVVMIENIPPGQYRVQVSAFGFSVSEKQVTIVSGQSQSIDDVLYPSGALRWALRDATGAAVINVPCTLTPVDASSIEEPRSGATNGSGIFVVRGLMPGAYTATATTSDGRAATAMINIYAGNATDEVTLMQ